MNRQRRPRFSIRPWYVPAAILAMLLVSFLVWLLPRKTHDVVTVDHEARWDQRAAPPQRKIVWQPARSVAAPVPAARQGDDFVRPQLANHGLTLYFTLQQADGSADIYRSQFDGDKWQEAAAVAQLNSPADEFGPVISADGNELYLYSNRPGGEGGYDIYLSRRTENGWSPPQNLGPTINTPAHEYDAAVSPDGRRLFFASNRTARMQDQVATRGQQQTGETPAEQPWKATLRAEQGLQEFDLYASSRDAASNAWQAPHPVHEVNTSANEGEPVISPDGAFLYFASNRANDHGGKGNYDLYRARLDEGQIAWVENLGTGVNTAANEHDPALSSEGFRLLFSSDRKADAAAAETDLPAVPDASQFALYESRAAEVFEETAWDMSHLLALRDAWWWILLAALLVALLAALLWYLRQVSLRRAPLPAFFLIALLFHMLLAASTFLVIFGDDIPFVDKFKKDLEELVATTVLDSSHQSHKPEKEAYEKVADLQAIETVKTTEAPRQATEMPNIPAPTSRPAPALPTRMSREATVQRMTMAEPEMSRPAEENPQLARRQRIVDQLMTEKVQFEQANEAQPTKSQQPTATEQVAVDRTKSTPVDSPTQLQRRQIDVAMKLETEQVSDARPQSNPDVPNSRVQPQEIQRLARNSAVELESPQVQAQAVTPTGGNPAAENQPTKVAVNVDRQGATADATAVPKAIRRTSGLPSAAPTSEAPSPQRVVSGAPASNQINTDPAPLTRVARNSFQPDAVPQVTTEQVTGAAESTPSDGQAAPRASVVVERSQNNSPVGNLASAALRRLSSTAGASSAATSELPRADAQSNTPAPSGAEVEAALARATPNASTNAPAEAMVEVSESASEGLTGGKGENQPSPGAVAVNVTQRTSDGPVSPASLAGSVASDAAVRIPTADLGAAAQGRLAAQFDAPSSDVDEVALIRSNGPRNIASIADAVATPLAGSEGLGEPASSSSPGVSGVAVDVSRQGATTSDVAQVGSPGASQADTESAAGSPESSALQRAILGSPGVKSTTGDVAANLGRAGRTNDQLARVTAETVGSETLPGAISGTEQGEATSVEGVDVGNPRFDSDSPLAVAVKTAGVLGGPHDSRRTDFALGQLAKQALDTPPSFDPIGTQLARRPALARFVPIAQDNIGLQSMLRMRVGDDESKKDLIEAFGGGDDTLAAIRRGLAWLAKVQQEDGHWALNKFPRGHNGQGSSSSQTAGTGLALLPFLGDGQTHKAGDYQKTVAGGIKWLVEHQKENGDLFTSGGGNDHMYSHGIAAIALCEAYGITKDPELRDPAQMAVNFIVTAQHKEGGWRYRPGDKGDTSVFGWQIMALKSAQMAGLEVPGATLDKARKWLESVKGGKDSGQFGYTDRGSKSPAMTAEGLLCLEYLGAPRSDPYLLRGVDYVANRLPKNNSDTSYYWYYATQSLFHMQGEPWQRWSEAMDDTLKGSQRKDGNMAGSWDPGDQWEKSGGRIYATSLRLLMLEVYYRHLPLYNLGQ